MYEVRGRLDDGIALTQAALAVDPFDPGLHLLLSNFRLATGELGAAEAEIRKMLQLSPTWYGAPLGLGQILRVQFID